jgi:hypothetical protein
VPHLGRPRQHVLGSLFAAQATSAPAAPDGEDGQDGGESRGVLALLRQSRIPPPGGGDGLGDGVVFLMRTFHVAEADAGMDDDPGKQREESLMQDFRVWKGTERVTRWDQRDNLRSDRPRAGTVVLKTRPPRMARATQIAVRAHALARRRKPVGTGRPVRD